MDSRDDKANLRNIQIPQRLIPCRCPDIGRPRDREPEHQVDGRPGRAVCSHDGAYVISFDAGRDHGDGHGLHADNRGGQREECLDANLGYLARNCSNPDQSVQTGSIQIESHVDGPLSTEADIWRALKPRQNWNSAHSRAHWFLRRCPSRRAASSLAEYSHPGYSEQPKNGLYGPVRGTIAPPQSGLGQT